MPETQKTTELQIDELLDDPKALSRLRILRAARQLLVARGVSISMDEVADAAGVGRRTLFRHFATRDLLIAAALSSALDWYNAEIDDIADDEGTLEEWLVGVVRQINRMHQKAGRAVWQLAATADADLPPQLAAVNQRRRRERRMSTNLIAQAAWVRAGGTGPCPAQVVNACALAFSSFTTHSMLDDFGTDLDALAACTAALLGRFLEAEVAASTLP